MRYFTQIALFSAFVALSAFPCVWLAQSIQASPQPEEPSKMKLTASGEFEVKITPEESGDKLMGIMLLSKSLHGDLEATGAGRMLTAGTEVKGSAAYVAIERITGKLHGKSGSFMLHHRGVMSAGTQSLSILVVPDSGTEELKGISGEFKIEITGGKHLYTFEYTLPN